MANPRWVVFTASPDHALVTSYVIGYFASGASQPIQEVDLGKPTPDTIAGCAAPAPCIQVAINIHPLSFGAAYIAKVKAVAGSLSSEWSDPSNLFDRVPGKTGVPVLVR